MDVQPGERRQHPPPSPTNRLVGILHDYLKPTPPKEHTADHHGSQSPLDIQTWVPSRNLVDRNVYHHPVTSTEHLFDPLQVPSVDKYVARVWAMRRYSWELGRSSLQASNSTTTLGSVWLFLEPLFSIIVYFLVFGVLLNISRGVENYLAFLVVGQITFGLGQRALLGASASLQRQAPMMQALSFPRAVLPLSEVLKALAAYRTEVIVMLLVLPLLGVVPNLTTVAIVPIVALQILTAFGLGMALARVVHRYGDIQRLLTHLMRLAFYGSGVFYPLVAFTDSQAILRLAAILNPFFDHLELTRWAVLGIAPASPALSMLMATVWAVAAVAAGGWFFVSAEDRYGARVIPA